MRWVLACFFVSLFFNNVVEAAPLPTAVHVVVTIKPAYSWVAAVMKGVGKPELLIKGGESVHTYSLKPSDAHLLAQADVVFFIDKSVEAFLQKSLQTIAAKAQAVPLSTAPGIKLLAARRGKYFEQHAGHHASFNPHIWLDPQNAIYATNYIAAILAKKDPQHAAAYLDNAKRYTNDLTTLIARTQQALAPYHKGKFIVFHDAYYYYEKRFGVQAVGAIMVDAAHQPSAKRLKEIRKKIAETKAICVFSEPQFTPKLLNVLVEGLDNVRVGKLDPLGADLPAEEGSYARLIDNITDSLVKGLKP